MENNTNVVKISTVAIGDKLKKSRENKSLTIDQVQKKTRIYSQVLSALEDGRCDELLNSTYVRSFLKKYADFLGLDSTEILKEYSASRQQKTPEAVQVPVKASPSTVRASTKVEHKAADPDIIFKIIYTISLAFLFLAFIFFVIFLTQNIIPSFSKTKASKSASYQPKGKTAVSHKISPQKKSLPVKEITSAKSVDTKSGPLYLVLKVNQQVLVKLKKDGVSLFERVLPKGTVESFKATNKIELYLARAEAVELTLDGKSLGSPGKGLIKNLEITKKGIKIK